MSQSAVEVIANCSTPEWVERAVARREGQLTSTGALDCFTGKRTGRSPKDRFIVRDALTESEVAWGGFNNPIEPEVAARILSKTRSYLESRNHFVQDGTVGADPRYRIRIRTVAEKAWHALFARCLFLRPASEELQSFQPDWTFYVAPELTFDPTQDGTRSDAAIVIDFCGKTVVISGTHYAGEIKKSAFGIMNFLLPRQNVFPMHCSANIGSAGDVALFFGLSGTGKTTLSADPDRRLIGDDEHGWSDSGVFNIEGGCYAKTIRLSKTGEPQIWAAIQFGSVLENVPLNPFTREPDYNSEKFTENTRAAYPVDFIPNAELSGQGGHPTNIFFLTCDAFGVLPPISKLNPEQAMDYFLTGYTAKVAGTEAGVTEPEKTFSTCFASPFLPLKPRRYAELLRERMLKYSVPVWLVNTGWTGGPYGIGKRMSLTHTRALIHAALEGKLQQVAYQPDPIFGLEVPVEAPGVPSSILQPRNAWSDPQEYDTKAKALAESFAREFAKYR
jgi:phosphoenolpyruvate carboxykinase (ATP)